MTYGKSGRILPGAGLLLAAVLVLSACSTSTTGGSFIDASGKHPASFVDAHPSYAGLDGSACAECHGDDLRGGISKVSCSTASRNGVGCHTSGPAFHPGDWVDTKARGTSAWHGDAYIDNVRINGLQCSTCHTLGTSGTPGTGKCVVCHFTYTSKPVRRIPVGNPTVHNWAYPQVAGHASSSFLNDNAVKAVCQACHDANTRFGNMPRCHNCHGG